MTPYHFCYVYILKSVHYAKLYVGYTKDLRTRLAQHNRGESKFTNRFKPWTLVYYEAFSNPKAAQTRESSLKHNGNPMRELKRRIGINGDVKVVRGFTLIETLAAVVLLTISITAPMLLTVRSLSSAYYARDQFTAFYLAQEGIEAIHQIRDNQILTIAQTSAGGINLFPFAIDATCAAPTTPRYFRVDARYTVPGDVIRGACNPDSCPALQSDGQLYGYGSAPEWTPTKFTRYVNACFVGGNQNEVQISVTVKWTPASQAERTFTISENMYRWVQDASGT